VTVVVQGSVREPLRRFAADRGIDRFVVLCDANLAAQADLVTRGMRGRLGVLAVPLSEKRKTLATVQQVLQMLMQAGADRGTAVIGVGGGVASDLFGFTASIFMRGVPYVHIATSLVAMIDAAIGGKTGVDLPAGKNLAGTFSDPIATFAWIDALQTLPYRHLREGLAEMVKHAIIEGGDLFESLETLAPHAFWRWPWEHMVSEAQGVKIAIVNDDREERGIREVLNLGHTFGHAIERASGYRVSHGAGVSIGLRAAGLLALKTGRFSREEHLRVITLLTLLKMPLATREAPDAVHRAMYADKKKRANRLRFVLPRSIGDVEYGITPQERAVRAVLSRIMRLPGGDEFR
jgi:3-dehydroquinate synthetase